MNINEVVRKNVKEVFEYYNHTYSKAVDYLDVKRATLSGYLNGDTAIPLSFVQKIIESDKYCNSSVTFNDITNPDVDIISLLEKASLTNYVRKDVAGCYMVYLFDQSKEHILNGDRELRYGVITVYESLDPHDKNDNRFKACGKFFKNKNEAKDFHKTISPVLSRDLENEDNLDEIQGVVQDYYSSSECYIGNVDFYEKHIYISLTSEYFGDKALFAMHRPPKKGDSEYIGGVAGLTSIAHGQLHYPCCQKALLSKCSLKCSDDEIADLIRINPVRISLQDDAKNMYDFFRKITSTDFIGALDENDIETLFANKFEHIITQYIKNNLNSVCVVSAEDDDKAYRLVKHTKSL